MARRYVDHDEGLLLRAARLAELPGVTRREAAERFGLSVGFVRRAVKQFGRRARPSRHDLVLHGLTGAGRRREGRLDRLGVLASFVDYVNKDGSTERDVRSMIDDLVESGHLAIDGNRWRLLRDWP